jgi:NAD+ diphosphatase
VSEGDVRAAETVTFGVPWDDVLDRAAHLRDGHGILDRATGAAARILPVWRGKPLVTGPADPDAPLSAGWLAAGHPVLAHAAEPPVFLGLAPGQAPRFSVDVSSWDPPEVPDTLGAFLDPSEQRHPDLTPDQRFAELRAAMTRLSGPEAGILATAKALLGWHATHRFCARCGTATAPAHAGWQRVCPACGAHHFPRTDPVVIMLVTRGDRLLLGRSPGWPPGMYSLLAGFVEPGETVEAAVRREVAEETGVRVGTVGYLVSQPWPYPASLMLGCRAKALSEDITIDPVELEAACWVTRAEMLAAVAGQHPDIRPPRRGAIAGFLIGHWLADTLD